MNLPTDYVPSEVSYVLAVEGDGVPPWVTLNLEVGKLSEKRVEELMPAYEAGFRAMGRQLRDLPGVTAVKLYRSFKGATEGIDIMEAQ